MATESNAGVDSAQTTPQGAPTTTQDAPTTRKTSARRSAARRSTTTRRATGRRSTAAATTSTQPKTRVEQAQQMAGRAFLVPVGASLLARDNLVSTVRGLATKYRTRASLERELKRYERRGASARNRFERQVRRTRTRFERELRQRRSHVERAVKQNRRRFEREVRSVRKDFEKQSQRLVSSAQELISNSAS
jgi:hypothetical protein